MTSAVRTRVATAFVVAVLAGVVLFREGKLSMPSLPSAQSRAEPQPQDAVYRMLDAIRDGDLKTYLDSHTGSAAESLRRTVEEMGEAKLIEALQRQNKPLKGIAVNEPERISPTQAKTRVEYVFADRNEVQTVFFENVQGTWRISRVDSAERIRTIVPYGTSVNDVK